jgi:LPS-assembly protein
VALAALASSLVLFLTPANAQDPSQRLPQATGQSDFPKQPGGMFGPPPQINRALPMYLQGDQLIYDTTNHRVIARGNVEIYYNNFILTADQVVYDQNTNRLIAEGNAQLKDPNGSITRADRFEATDDFRDAFVQTLSMVTRDDTRIAAERATRREGNVTEFEQGRFTPCKNDPGSPPLWCISGARIIHDQQAASIVYQDAQFEFFGVPILYLPYFEHPDPSVKHRSGFLTPEFGYSSTLGFMTTIPYYFALSPSYDFTFAPTYISNEGVLFNGEWRQKLENGTYNIKFSVIDQSNQNGDPTVTALDGFRGSVQTRGLFSLSSWWKYGWDVTLESDDSFRRYYKLDNVLEVDRVNTGFLVGQSDRNYFAANFYEFGSLLFTNTAVANSRVLPNIDYNYIFADPVLDGELSLTAYMRSMTRTNNGTDTNHAVAEANWRRKLIDPIGEVFTPFVRVRGDIYNYADATNPDDPALLIPDNTVVYGTAAAGVTYSYPFVLNTVNSSHVIEPTAQIIARPNQVVNQRQLPDEDAQSLIFDDTLLFDIDKFSGYDRFETGTRANVGLQYTFQSYSGPYMRAVFGQSYQIAGQNAFDNPGLNSVGVFNFSPVSGLQTDKSDYVAGVYLSPINYVNLIAQGRFDQSDFSLHWGETLATLNYGPITTNVGYSYIQNDPAVVTSPPEQEILGGLGLKLTDRWSVQGTVRYDIENKQVIQDIASLKYKDECFVLTTQYTETFINNPALGIVPDRTLMVRFELKNLGEFSYQTDVLNNMFGDNQPPKL